MWTTKKNNSFIKEENQKSGITGGRGGFQDLSGQTISKSCVLVHVISATNNLLLILANTNNQNKSTFLALKKMLDMPQNWKLLYPCIKDYMGGREVG